MDNVAAARYLLAKKKDVTSYSGINQNYAWGQDSWRDFVGAMKVLAPKADDGQGLFPKLFAGEYGAEISTLLTSKSQVLHTSFYDGDLEAFLYQEQARALDKRMTDHCDDRRSRRSGACATRCRTAPSSAPAVRTAPLAPDTELNRWFQKIYTDRYNIPPTYPAYQMAMSLLGLKIGLRKGQEGGAKPTTDDVVAAFKGIEFEGPVGQGQARHRRWAPGHLARPPTAPIGSTSRRTSPRSSTSCASPPNA